jgi:hypothetical protein
MALSDNELKFDKLKADSVVKSLVNFLSLCLQLYGNLND